MEALIIIDMQESAFTNSDKFDTNGVIDRINRLSGHVRKKGGKVIFIQHDGTVKENCAPFTAGWKILSSLNRTDSDIVVRKTLNDAFYSTDLDKQLRKRGIKKVIISGWATDFCVDAAVRSAVSRGYDVVVASDCHTVSDRPHLKAEQVIEHHNWIWGNLVTSGNNVELLSAGQILA
ncbi:MAG: cysteine hydrolase [bacterium]|nr:cysteine hydrolase [bacterium]